jgi:Na+-transporting methylmalonyl-CoA/oxaloacetate decarboxylase gamma subunit
MNNLLAATEHLAGLAVVMFALTCLWALTALMGWVVGRLNRPAAALVQQKVTQPDRAAASDDDDVVVVAAAATMLLGPTARVVAVRPHASSWADHGRRDIHVSHRVR